jgi:hypothetical protein
VYNELYIHQATECINQNTGELFYYQITKASYTTEVSKSRHFYEARDVEELQEIVGRYGEKRYSNVTYSLNKDKLGKWYIPILTVCSKTDYFNVGFYDRVYLCDVFKVSDSNLNKTLNKFVKMGLLKYTGKGLTFSTSKPQIRIIWNPISVWKGWEHSVTKIVCIQEWYKGLFDYKDIPEVECDSDVVYIPKVFEDIPVISPDPYVSPYFNYESKVVFRYLMDIPDAEFELLMLSNEGIKLPRY